MRCAGAQQEGEEGGGGPRPNNPCGVMLGEITRTCTRNGDLLNASMETVSDPGVAIY